MQGRVPRTVKPGLPAEAIRVQGRGCEGWGAEGGLITAAAATPRGREVATRGVLVRRQTQDRQASMQCAMVAAQAAITWVPMCTTSYVRLTPAAARKHCSMRSTAMQRLLQEHRNLGPGLPEVQSAVMAKGWHRE